jgi:ABC-type transporter Mla maintaining outer membrane lipid asymmetry permease subunit MlaE
MRFSDYMLLLVREVGIDDFVVFVLKTLVFGLLIGGATMYRALGVQKAFTSVPVALIKALVSLLLYIMVVEGVFALITTAL